MKILQADDHPIFCEGIQLILKQLADHVHILKANSIEDCLQLLNLHEDICLIILDLGMPGMEDLEGFYTIRKFKGQIPLVILSASEDIQHIRSTMEGGARGYIPKTANSEIILNALKLILSGGRYLPELLLNPLTNQMNPPGKKRYTLSVRQREVLKLIANGHSNKEISRLINISENTVKAHIRDTLKLLNVKTRTQAVVKAQTLGEID